MSFSQGFFFHEHLLPVWDSNIKHNGFLPLSSPAPLCGSFHSQTLVFRPPVEISFRLSPWSVRARRSNCDEFSQTLFQKRALARKGQGFAEHVAIFYLFFFATYQSWRGACQELHVATPKYKSRSTRQFPMVDLLYEKEKKKIREAKKCQVSFCLFG